MKISISDRGAIGFAVAGFTFWVLTDTCIKLVGQSSLPAYEVTGFLGLFIALFMAAYALARGELRELWPHHMGRQTLRSCLDLGTNLSVVVALRHLSLTLFYILIFLAPIVTSAMGAVFLREGLTWRKALAIIAGFAGVVIAVDPFGSTRQGDWVGFAACMACVAFFSVNMVWSRVLTQTERPDSLTFFSGVVMGAACFGLMLWHAAPLTARLTGGLVAMGLFCALGSLFFFVALKHTTAATVSQYHYTQLLTGALLAYLIWHTRPTLSMVLGAVLIVASGLYIAVTAPRSTMPAMSAPGVAPD
ncbi:MAG TPA: DMT family transporter [Acidobacteriaceae bacterium]|nr:DMT family transporter [Acidobacteriaceae bacterium]